MAASLLDKCDALVHRNLRSVTSIGPGGGNSFNSNDSANLAVGQKPKVLELANRRLVSTSSFNLFGSEVVVLTLNE